MSKKRRDRNTQKLPPAAPKPAPKPAAPAETAGTASPAAPVAAVTAVAPLSAPSPDVSLPPATGSHHGPHELETGKVGMIAFLVTEVAFFSTLIVTYITYIGRDKLRNNGPYPGEVFVLWQVVLSSICLFSSSYTIHLAEGALRRGDLPLFRRWLAATIGLGALFLFGTAVEWHDLYFHWGLSPWRNLFGATYYTLVGFHALHVTIGLLIMLLLLRFAFSRYRPAAWPLNPELVSWYWHFVDGVWVVVFTVVYLVGR